jgi:hypothetical protein
MLLAHAAILMMPINAKRYSILLERTSLEKTGGRENLAGMDAP